LTAAHTAQAIGKDDSTLPDEQHEREKGDRDKVEILLRKLRKKPREHPDCQEDHGEVQGGVPLAGAHREVAALQEMINPYQGDGEQEIALEKVGNNCHGGSVGSPVYRDGYLRSIRYILKRWMENGKG
jgi:hypothetical protein